MKLIRNVSRKDKNIRMAVGIVLLLIGLFFGGFFLGIIGLYALASGLLSHCWIYKLLGMNTASITEQTTASEDLSERAVENLEDFKEEAVETAGELKDKAEDAVDDFKQSDIGKKAEEKFDDLKEKAGDVVDDIKSGEFTKDAKEKFSELKEDASELVDSAKDKLAQSKDTPPKDNFPKS